MKWKMKEMIPVADFKRDRKLWITPFLCNVFFDLLIWANWLTLMLIFPPANLFMQIFTLTQCWIFCRSYCVICYYCLKFARHHCCFLTGFLLYFVGVLVACTAALFEGRIEEILGSFVRIFSKDVFSSRTFCKNVFNQYGEVSAVLSQLAKIQLYLHGILRFTALKDVTFDTD